MSKKQYLVWVLLMLPVLVGHTQDIPVQNSVFATGAWKRMAILEEGIYKLTPEQFPHLRGKPVQEIVVHGIDWGDLPQENSANFPLDPPRLPVEVIDGGDGVFNDGDYLLVYLRPANRFEPVAYSDVFLLSHNHYSDTAWYYVGHISGVASQHQLSAESSLWDGQNVIKETDFAQYYRADKFSRLSSGREWYGEIFSASAQARLYQFSEREQVQNGEIKLAVSVLGYTFAPASFEVRLNGTNVGEVVIPSVPDDRYAQKGSVERDTFRVQGSLVTGVPQVVIDFKRNASSRISEGYMDHIIYQVKVPLKAQNAPLFFSSYKSLDQAVSNFELIKQGVVTDIWDVSDFLAIHKQTFEETTSAYRFGDTGLRLGRYVAFNRNGALKAPVVVKDFTNQNVKETPVADFIILTHSRFRADAERLAAFRASANGFDVEVVDVGQVYHEFGAGRKDVTALRNFLKYMYRRSDSPQRLKYVLLMGKGTYDFKDILGTGNNFIPVYQSRNSLHPLLTYGSDDYLGFLEDDEGEWEENFLGDHDLDIAVGRLPVVTVEQAVKVVDKLIAYEEDEILSDWKKKVVFVADDGDFNIHQDQSDQLATQIDQSYPGVEPFRLFLDNFEQIGEQGSDRSPAMAEALETTVKEGALIVNFTGHGGPGIWMQESVLRDTDIQLWENENRLPLFVTATCEFGRHDSPFRISGGEWIILNPSGGGIALVTTSRPVFSSTNFVLNQAFYEEVFRQVDGRYQTIGEVFRNTKNASANGVSNRNFSLLGDPSMTLAYPDEEVRGVTLNGGPLADGVVEGLFEHTLAGEVVDGDGQLRSDFQGEVEVIVFDQLEEKSTLGNESVPFTYTEWDSRIFSGKSHVTDGHFELQFMAPFNVKEGGGVGKISMYAYSNSGEDAWGADFSVQIGGVNPSPASDTQSPEITLYMNDKSFKSGGITSPNTRLLVIAEDPSGIGISNAGGLTRNVAVLDGAVEYELNAYYRASVDDYTEGTFDLPLYNLMPGKHVISVTVFDSYGNVSTDEITFYVSEGEAIQIQQFSNAPNPFQESTTLSFAHNQPGKDLLVKLQVATLAGQVLLEKEYTVEDSNTVVELETISPPWPGDSGRYGFYIAVIQVISLEDGTKNTAHCKLIYLN